MSLAIETEKLVKIYGNGKSMVKALNSIDMKVPKASVFGLFGPNGSGKTTLISILVGLLLPTSGSARVLGFDAAKHSVEIRRRVGLLPEGFGFYDHMTALENLTFLATLDGIPSDQRRKRALEALETVGLKDRADAKVSTFSRGMRQRLGVAQALLKDPELLIFDEPTVGIDPEGAAEFRNLVRRMNREGKTILLSTHLLYEVGMICTHAAIIREGRLLVQGSVDELYQSVRKEKGFRYEIRVKPGSEIPLQEIRSMPSVVEITQSDNRVTILSKNDIGSSLFSLITKSPYKDLVESLTPVEPSWEEIYRFYQEGG
ncbi:MAG: ABC transporter ATP-binding protein [Candidatus Brockarchaeota archaeon]|nr:ABC transporter ATP-binding protein [Candidatus Brockarchaeota archaeon]